MSRFTGRMTERSTVRYTDRTRKELTRPDTTGPDRTLPDQTTPDQTVEKRWLSRHAIATYPTRAIATTCMPGASR